MMFVYSLYTQQYALWLFYIYFFINQLKFSQSKKKDEQDYKLKFSNNSIQINRISDVFNWSFFHLQFCNDWKRIKNVYVNV